MVFKFAKMADEEVVLFAKDRDAKPRGKWMRVTTEGFPITGQPGKVRVPVLFCPVCKMDNLIVRHQINPDGLLVPEFACGNKCGFNDWVELEGWR